MSALWCAWTRASPIMKFEAVRVRRADRRAYLTIKGERAGIARPEFEYEIPVDDAEELAPTVRPVAWVRQ